MKDKLSRIISAWIKILVKWFVRLAIAFFALLLLLVILVYLPPVQNTITNKIEKTLSNTFHSKVHIGALNLNLFGDIVMKDISINDLSGKEALRCEKVNLDFSWFPIIYQEIDIGRISITGFKSYVEIDAQSSETNLDFIINAFSDNEQGQENGHSQWDILFSEISVRESDFSLTILKNLNLEVKIGSLKLLNEESDLNNLLFNIKDVDLKHINVSLELFQDSIKSNIISQSGEPLERKPRQNVLSNLRMMNIQDLNFDLNIHDQFQLSTEIPSFEGKNIYFNFLERVIKVSDLKLLKSIAEINIPDRNNVKTHKTVSNENINDLFIKNFDWDINSENAVLENCEFKYDDQSVIDIGKIINPAHLNLKNINIHFKDAQLANQRLKANITKLDFSENKGFNLREFNAAINYAGDNFTVESLRLKTDSSQIQANFLARSNMLYKVPEHLEKIDFKLELKQLHINSRDLDYFMQNNPLAAKDIGILDLSLSANGNPADFNLEKLELLLDDKVSINMNGQLKNLPNPKKICFGDINTEIFIKTPFLLDNLDSIKNLKLNLPEELTIKSKLDGCDKIHMESNLESSQGNLSLLADYFKPQNDLEDSLNIDLKVSGLEMGQILNVDNLGKLSFRNTASISGLKEGPESFVMELFLDTLFYNQEPITDIHLYSMYHNNDFNLEMESLDSLLNFTFKINGNRVDSSLILTSDVYLRLLDLSRFGFLKEPFQLSTHFTSEEKIGKGFFEGSFEFPDLVIKSENSYSFDTISMFLHTKYDSLSFNLRSTPINGYIQSNIPLNEIGDRLFDFYKYHFVKEDTIPCSRYGNLQFSFTSDQPIKNLIALLPGLEEFQFSRIEGQLDECSRMSNFEISIPRIKYRDLAFDSLSLQIKSSPENLNYNFNIPAIAQTQYNIRNLKVSGQTEQGVVTNVLVIKGNSPLPLLRTEFTIDPSQSNQILFHLSPDSLIINSKLWETKGDNEIIVNKQKKIFGSIHISDGQESLLILASDTVYQVNITDFQLANLTRFMQNFDSTFEIAGELNMVSDIDLKYRNTQVSTALTLTDFTYKKTEFGNITIHLANDIDNNISGQLALENGNNNLQIKGRYKLNDENMPLSADVQLNFNDLERFNSFGNNLISDPKGEIHGNLTVRGNKDNLNTNGEVVLKSVNMLLTPVNNQYHINNESISVVNNRFNLSEFTMLDSADNSFILNGFIQYVPFNKFNIDLGVKADRFTFYNVKKETNSTLYGKLIMSMDAGIKGSMENPNILVNMSIDNGTNMVYALPPKNFDLVNSEGVVEFVNFSEEDSTVAIGFQQYIGDTILSKLNWIDLNAVLTIDKTAQFMIDMDPVSGDYIQFGGSGNLNFVVQNNQMPQVSGTYVFDRGIYEVSFYGLVKKSFRFQPGSSITWSGDPFNALLNLKAGYSIRTASVGLVSKEIYGLSDEERNQYRRALSYSVGININGQLNNPVIGFKIDLPEEEKNAFPLVESKLNQLNGSGHESELARQVFGLLTIGSFIPETTGPGSSSGYGSALATTAAANSLNAILSNELNKLSGKYIKFADLDVGMQTYSDLEGGSQTTRTTMDIRLSKKLFDDRVTIEAQGSFDLQNESDKYMHASEQSNVYNDFAIIYDLREKGDYKLKAFQRSAYDIIYKNTQMGGVAFIFIKEFDTYRKDRKSED